MPTPIAFGTDGWRAIIAEEFTFPNVRALAASVARLLHATGMAERGLVVGWDTRFASDRFAEVVTAAGIKVYLAESFAPTPACSYMVLKQRAGGGVVITSSHNPAAYNGFKYKPEYAGSASPEVVARLEERIAAHQAAGHVERLPLAAAQRQGRVALIDARAPCFAQLARLVDLERLRASRLRVVHDALYGAGMGYFGELLGDGVRT